MTVGDLDNTEWYDYLVYPLGAFNYKVKNGATGLVAFESNNGAGPADALATLNYCRDQITNVGKTVALKDGYYPVSATFLLDNTAVTGNAASLQAYTGIHSRWGLAQIRALGNFPAITIKNTTIELENLYLTHNTAGYTADVVEILDGCANVSINRCRFNDFLRYAGSAVGLHIADGTKSQYKIDITDCNMNGFDNNIRVRQDAGAALTGWMNSIRISNNYFWGSKRALKVEGTTGQAGNHMEEWHWIDNHWQYDGLNPTPSNEAVFMYEGASNTVPCRGQHFTQTVTWDTPANVNFANFKVGDDADFYGCRNDNKIGGAGAGGITIIRDSSYITRKGQATLSGTGSTRDFNITHSLNVIPKKVSVNAVSIDAAYAGNPVVTAITSTNITVRFRRPPRQGSNNVLVSFVISL